MKTYFQRNENKTQNFKNCANFTAKKCLQGNVEFEMTIIKSMLSSIHENEVNKLKVGRMKEKQRKSRKSI